MSVTEVEQALGSFELELLGNVPRDVLDSIDYFGHIAIIPGRLDPRQYGDGCLGAARYVGVVRRKKYADDGRTNLIQDDIRIEGVHMNFWLGDDDNKGYIFENPVNFTTATFSNVMSPVASGGLIPPSLSVGTIHPIIGTYTGQHQYQTPRAAVQYVCDTLSDNSSISGTGNGRITWRVNPDGTFDAGPERDMVVVNPTCIIMRKGSTQGEDMVLRSLPSTIDMDMDMEDFSTRVVMLAESDGSSLATGSADIGTVSPGTNVYKDIHGNTLNLTKLVSESDTIEQWADVRAELALRDVLDPHRALTLNADDFDIQGSFTVGDYVWVYDPDGGLVDTSNEVYIRGVRINPIMLRVTETDWPITEGYTVAYRASDGTWKDLTDYIHWEETQPSKIVVGDFNRTLIGANGESVPIRIGTLSGTDTTTPDVPAFTTPFTSSGYENGDSLKSLAVVQWSTPSNTDLTTVTDGNVYEIGFKLSSQSAWETRLVGWGTNTLLLQELSPNVSYDFRIRATDINGNQSAWSSTYTQTTSATASTPTAPAAPTVTSDSAEDGQGVLKSFAQVSWSQPLNTDSTPIVDGSYYEVQWKLNTASVWESQSVAWGTTTTLIGNLNPATLYNFKVRAVDTSGNIGAFSTATNHTTASSASTPAAPALPTVSSDSAEDTSGVLKANALVSWSQPLNTNGSAIIDGSYYEVQYKLTSASNWASQNVAWGTTSTYINNLNAGASADFKVRAADNSGHIGAFSSTKTVLLSSTPSVPAAPTFTTPFATASYETNQGTKAQILVVWTTPLNTDASTIIDGAYYEVHYKLTTQSAWDVRTVAWGTNQILFLDLLPNTSYDFRMRAVDNSGRIGAFTSTVSRTTGNSPTIPNAPTWTTGSFTSTQYADANGLSRASATVVWSTPTNTDASAITDGDHYEIQIQKNGDSDWAIVNVAWGTNTYRFLDLSVGTQYNIRIRAWDIGHNASGFTTTNFTTAQDLTPPSQPAAPTVAASMVAVQITHTLGKNSGGTYNLESDLAYFEVHQGTLSGFTPSTSTLIGILPATQANIISGVPVVRTFPTSVTTNQYYKVMAVDLSGNKQTNPSPGAPATATLIDDAHISDLTVSKVTAGTISANWLLGSSIRTAASGARVELNTTGFQAYDSGSNNTVTISNSGTFSLQSPPSSATTPVVEWVGASPAWSDSAAGTNFTLYKPAGVTVGDLMVAFVTTAANNPASITTIPSGWSLVTASPISANHGTSGADTELWVFKKTFASGDPSQWDDGATTSTTGRQAVVVAYRGADTAANQFVATGSNTTITASGALAVTATNSNAAAWRLVAFSANDDVVGGSWTSDENVERSDTTVVSGTRSISMMIADSNASVAATSHTKTGTFVPGSSTNFTSAAAWIGYIKPLPTSQSRIVMDYQGIRAYDQVNTKTLDIGAARGTIDLQGSVSSLNYLEGADGWRIDGGGSAQFANINVLNTIGADNGSFNTGLMLGGVDVATEDFYKIKAPCVRVARESALSLNSADNVAGTVIPWDVEYYQRNTPVPMHDTSGVSIPQSRLVAPVDGIYQFTLTASERWTGGSPTDSSYWYKVNKNANGSWSGGTLVAQSFDHSTGSFFGYSSICTEVAMTAGDYLEVFTSVNFNGSAGTASRQLNVGVGESGASLRYVASLEGSGTGGTNVSTITFDAIGCQSYDGSGAKRGVDDINRAYQGYFSGTYGNQKSVLMFNDAAIASALSGKTVSACKLRYHVLHSYYSTMDVYVGTHNATSVPTTWPPTGAQTGRFVFANQAQGATYIQSLGVATGQEFQAGTTKGITIGPGPGNVFNAYGYLSGYVPSFPSYIPQLQFTYTS